jgi:hypothetical protein
MELLPITVYLVKINTWKTNNVLTHVLLVSGVIQKLTNVKIVTLHVIHVLMHPPLDVHLVLLHYTLIPLPVNVKQFVIPVNMEILQTGHVNLVIIHVHNVLQLMSVLNVTMEPDMPYIMDNVSHLAQMDIMTTVVTAKLVIHLVTLVSVVVPIVVILVRQHLTNT